MLVGDQHASRSKIRYKFVKWYKAYKCSVQDSAEIKINLKFQANFCIAFNSNTEKCK